MVFRFDWTMYIILSNVILSLFSTRMAGLESSRDSYGGTVSLTFHKSDICIDTLNLNACFSPLEPLVFSPEN